MMFNTSFSYDVLDAITSVLQRVNKAKNDPALQYDMLFALSYQLEENDVWAHDHEVGWGGGKVLNKLAAAWKKLLAQSDDSLKIDPEFTRPGTVYLLDKLKKLCDNVDGCKFKFQ